MLLTSVRRAMCLGTELVTTNVVTVFTERLTNVKCPSFNRLVIRSMLRVQLYTVQLVLIGWRLERLRLVTLSVTTCKLASPGVNCVKSPVPLS